MGGALTELLATYNAPADPPRETANAMLDVVEIYPYVPYIQYLLPGTITLAIFVSAMIGGGIIFIDDKARGLHEGYLVTPIRKFELILGFNLAGAIKAIIAGFVLVTVGSIIAGIPDPLNALRLARMMVLVVATALALISMMFLLMVRVSDPLVPRAIFGVLNTVLFFPSGAVYPTASFPPWMKAITVVDPFTYAVHGFKQLVLKNTGLMPISFDLAFLFGFTAAGHERSHAAFPAHALTHGSPKRIKPPAFPCRRGNQSLLPFPTSPARHPSSHRAGAGRN